jgi:hypothetical protein
MSLQIHTISQFNVRMIAEFFSITAAGGDRFGNSVRFNIFVGVLENIAAVSELFRYFFLL